MLFRTITENHIHTTSIISTDAEKLRQELKSKGTCLLNLMSSPGSGKTTTQACIIDQINKNRDCHIVTLEDPIEYLHRHKKSIVSQREVTIDTKDYLSALRACVRQAPDVILLGEMRDPETIRTAITAAETGHLVLATLHTNSAAQTIDRVVDSFPASQQNQIRQEIEDLKKQLDTAKQKLKDANTKRKQSIQL